MATGQALVQVPGRSLYLPQVRGQVEKEVRKTRGAIGGQTADCPVRFTKSVVLSVIERYRCSTKASKTRHSTVIGVRCVLLHLVNFENAIFRALDSVKVPRSPCLPVEPRLRARIWCFGTPPVQSIGFSGLEVMEKGKVRHFRRDYVSNIRLSLLLSTSLALFCGGWNAQVTLLHDSLRCYQ